jgi:HlyD family secretion protein
MEIVPDSDELQVEAHVQPKDIDHVHMGQDAFVRFSAFNQRTTPQLTGQVAFVSADTTVDQHNPNARLPRSIRCASSCRRKNGAGSATFS